MKKQSVYEMLDDDCVDLFSFLEQRFLQNYRFGSRIQQKRLSFMTSSIRENNLNIFLELDHDPNSLDLVRSKIEANVNGSI